MTLPMLDAALDYVGFAHTREVRHGHIFCGIGGGAKGFNKGQARIARLQAKFRCLGGVDVDAKTVTDFGRMAKVPGTVLDLFSYEQYRAFHGYAPPPGWREALPDDIRRAFGYEHPHIIFLSAPCKGFSGLLSEARSQSVKYQALNELALRGVMLTLEAYKDDPVELLLFENVPRIAKRGRRLLDQIRGLLEGYGYAVAETAHDCGELGGLSQSRRRFLLVARHIQKVPPYLFVPYKHPILSVGKLLDKLPLPEDQRAGPLHRIPRLRWQTWMRLALVEAGKDWRSLERLHVENGYVTDYVLTAEPSSSDADATKPIFAIADPRIAGHPRSVQLGVQHWDQPAPTVTGQMWPGQGPFCIADPRPGLVRNAGDHYRTAGHYGVVPWDRSAYAVTAHGRHDNGYHNVADPRLPAATDGVATIIRAPDNTWHRPFTTYEMAALQGFIDPDDPYFELTADSDRSHRERIGNAVPPPSAEAIASVMGTVLLLAWSGETFVLGSTDIWVRDMVIGLVMPQQQSQLQLPSQFMH